MPPNQENSIVTNDEILIGEVQISFAKSQIISGGEETSVQIKSMQIFHCLVSFYPKPCPRQYFIDTIWDGNEYVGAKALTDGIYRLRKAGLSDAIKTISKSGYVLNWAPLPQELEAVNAQSKHPAGETRNKRYIWTFVVLTALLGLAALLFTVIDFIDILKLFGDLHPIEE
ncbi:MAG: helix-turn-helix domain-containing protein [Kordiimonadaceae bacterium]|nr:helix-turn-helix domain-containing protein [Kordiimonadaceae bacterium]